MSVWEAGRVWRESPHKGAALCVLLSAAFESDDEGVCYLKLKTLARDARVSKRAVQLILPKLQKSGDLTCTTKSSGEHVASRYQLGVKYLHPSAQNGCNQFAQGVKSVRARGENFARPLFRENKPMGVNLCGEISTAKEPKPPAADRSNVCPYCDNTGIFEAQDGRLKGFCECAAGQELKRQAAASEARVTGRMPERVRNARTANAVR